jgi:hypothetical protein
MVLEKGTKRDSSEGYFSRLPEDLIFLIFSFADVCSLGRIAQVSNCFLATVSLDDAVWGEIVKDRFCLDISNPRSKKTLGGQTWKEVYHSLSRRNRIPKSRYTPARKAVFAKGGGVTRRSNSAIAVWVLLSHTEDCLTRRSVHDESNMEGGRGDTRFVELNVCIQNVKSGQGDVRVNLIDCTLELMGNVDVGHQRVWMKPRVLYRSKGDVSVLARLRSKVDTIVLQPFEFCVVSMHFPCQEDLYETDLLSRAVSLSVPFSCAGDRTTNIANARFIDDTEIWDYYVELPGACLTLTDRSRLVAA